MINEDLYHIYLNDQCVRHCLSIDEFKKEMQYIEAFLQLTHLDNSARLEYVQCDPPASALIDGSY